MNNPDPLAQLRDIQLPEPIGFWPPAPGWWLLFALLLGLVTWGLWIKWRTYQNQRYRRQALAELTALRHLELDTAAQLQALNGLLRRCLLSAAPEQRELASQGGSPWLALLDRTCPACQQAFQQGAGQALATGPYERNPQADLDALYSLCRLWIEKHTPKLATAPASSAPVTPATGEASHV